MLPLSDASCIQLVIQFVKEENIPFGGVQLANVLLGRDTRPSGDVLLEAAKQVRAVILTLDTINLYSVNMFDNLISTCVGEGNQFYNQRCCD